MSISNKRDRKTTWDDTDHPPWIPRPLAGPEAGPAVKQALAGGTR